jgi:hypothetical protein
MRTKRTALLYPFAVRQTSRDAGGNASGHLVSLSSGGTSLRMVLPCSARRPAASTSSKEWHSVSSPFDFVFGPGAPSAIWPVAAKHMMIAAALWHPDRLSSLTT